MSNPRDSRHEARSARTLGPADRNAAELLTVEEVAALLKVPKTWVYERTRRTRRRLPHIKLGKYLRFEEAAVLEFIDRNRRGYGQGACVKYPLPS